MRNTQERLHLCWRSLSSSQYSSYPVNTIPLHMRFPSVSLLNMCSNGVLKDIYMPQLLLEDTVVLVKWESQGGINHQIGVAKAPCGLQTKKLKALVRQQVRTQKKQPR